MVKYLCLAIWNGVIVLYTDIQGPDSPAQQRIASKAFSVRLFIWYCKSSQKHAYISLTPINPTFI